MKMPQFVILLVTVLVQVAAGLPADRRTPPSQDKHASWDDVNVVAHGLLQLGLGLKEHVDKTKVGMRDLERKQQEQGEALRARTKEVEERDRLVAELRLLVAQNRRIDQLVEKIKQQQDKLEKQSLHLQALQVKVSGERKTSLQDDPCDQTTSFKFPVFLVPSERARDCQDLFVQGQRASGVYSIQPEGSQPFNVLCEMTSEAGWTVIQKRYDGSQNFNQLWERYKRGFGSLNGEFWLGLENIHAISKQGSYILQVELTDGAGRQLPVARYRLRLDGEEEKFSLHLEEESSSGVQEKVMSTRASGLPFSTADRDNDLAAEVNCAELLSGATSLALRRLHSQTDQQRFKIPQQQQKKKKLSENPNK
uniref:Fibrinogen C-terminal domain-containing protein n=1 Tax=Mola mola TaxID=94237 RepID=A0A3Q3W1D9_MOLML